MTPAYMNHGRWVADCGREGCPEAHKVTPGDSFTCENCGWVGTVRFPESVEDIERVLAKRPVPQTRNWWPWETVETLEVENMLHGVT